MVSTLVFPLAMPGPRAQIQHMSAMQGDASIDWTEEDVPVSTRFGDSYYARRDGRSETRYVFVEGNGLHRRWTRGSCDFRIAELGFGTGLGFLSAWEAWEQSAPPGRMLDFTSFEMFPLTRADMARALAAWPELEPLATSLLAAWPLSGPYDFGSARLTLIPGDARETLPGWHGKADAWFLDGFAPARNPEMWAPELMAEVGRKTAPGGTFATYTAAGWVRRSLEQSGFAVERMPGYGGKRHMTFGRLVI